VDAYDLLESETLNLVSDLADAILLIAGVELDDEMVKKVNQLRLLNVSDTNENNVDVRYITKDAPTHEETKQRLHDDIFSLSMIPDVNSKDFGEALSGTALKLRLASMEFLAGVMEGFAKLGLRRLIELWANVGQLLGGVSTDEIIKNLSIRMTRNTVSNEAEQIQNALQLSSLISKESVLALLQAFIPDVEVELERLNTEREESIAFMQEEFNAQQPKQDDEEEQDEDKE
jgi:SPP1 family phage portal protein